MLKSFVFLVHHFLNIQNNLCNISNYYRILEMNSQNGRPSIRKLLRNKNNVKFSSKADLIHSSRDNSQKKFRQILTADHSKRVTLQTQRRKNYAKFQQDEQIAKALNQIQERGGAFYKLGFSSLEKGAKEKKIFSEFFNLKLKDTKGTMSTGQLWSNKDRSNFLKENKIHLNKVKLLEKIGMLKKNERKRIDKIGQSKNIFGSMGSIMNMDTYSYIGTARTLGQSGSKRNMINQLNQMRGDLANLHSKTPKGLKLQGMVKDMEMQSQNMQKLQDKYFQKLIEMC